MLGLTLKAARVNNNLTQGEAAGLIGVSTYTVSKWERGKTFPSTKWLPAIERAYNVKYDDIIFLSSNYALSVNKTEQKEETK